MAHYQLDDPAKATAHAESVAPCSVGVWRTPEGVHFVVDKVGSYVHEGADLLDGKYVGRGESADSIRAWMEKTAALYLALRRPQLRSFHAPKVNRWRRDRFREDPPRRRPASCPES